MVPRSLSLSTQGAELDGLVQSLLAEHPSGLPGHPPAGGRRLIGVAGAPGAGKSTLVQVLVATLGPVAVGVPLDGFHLADVELRRQGLLERKGAPETFDAWGYAALLDRIRRRPEHVIYAPGFERDLEQPLAGAIPVPTEAIVVVSEGNYLLLDRPEWRAASALFDELWFVRVDPELRRSRLVDRHVAFGKSRDAAVSWVTRVDEANAALVEAAESRADLVLDVTDWTWP